MKKVLLIDDDIDIHAIIKHAIGNQFTLFTASTLAEGEMVLKDHEIELLILDEMLPDGRGSDLCYRVKNHFNLPHLPIIMLTQKRDLQDKLTAFNSGADDYLVKPFEPLELRARMQARLRAPAPVQEGNIVERGDLVLDLATQSVSIKNHDELEDLDLTPIEFKILYFLAKDPGSIHNRADILKNVWGENNHVIERTVDQHISKLRKKMATSEFSIKSLHKKGYLFTRKD